MNAFCWNYWKNMTFLYNFTCCEDITTIFILWNVDHILPKKTVLLKEWSVSKRNAPKEIDFTACNPSNCALYYFHSLRSLLFALRTLLQGRIHDFKKKGSNTKWGLISLFQVSFLSIFINIPHENEMIWSQWGQGTSSGSATVQRLMITYQTCNVRFLLDSDQETYG